MEASSGNSSPCPVGRGRDRDSGFVRTSRRQHFLECDQEYGNASAVGTVISLQFSVKNQTKAIALYLGLS